MHASYILIVEQHQPTIIFNEYVIKAAFIPAAYNDNLIPISRRRNRYILLLNAKTRFLCYAGIFRGRNFAIR